MFLVVVVVVVVVVAVVAVVKVIAPVLFRQISRLCEAELKAHNLKILSSAIFVTNCMF